MSLCDVVAFCGEEDAVLVSHNGHGFDARFLMAAFESASIAMPAGWGFGDSLQYLRRLFPRAPSVGEAPHLPAGIHPTILLGLPVPPNLHRAMADCKVLDCFLQKLASCSIQVVDHLGSSALAAPDLLASKKRPRTWCQQSISDNAIITVVSHRDSTSGVCMCVCKCVLLCLSPDPHLRLVVADASNIALAFCLNSTCVGL